MPYNDTLQVMDGELSDQIDGVHGRLNGGTTTLKLFTNDRDPDPEDETTDYTEATFDGYAAVDTTGEWSTPARESAGVWYTQTEIYTFEVTDLGGVDTEEIHGVYLVLSGAVVLAGRLPAPVTLSLGGAPLRIRVVYKQYAGLVLATIVLA